MMDTGATASFLKESVELFKVFSSESLIEIITVSQTVSFEPNEAIIEFGEEGKFLGVLLDGRAEASVTDDSGGRHCIAVIEKSGIFGEMSLMTGDRTVADVIAVTRCTALCIPRDVVSTNILTHPQALRLLSHMITDRSKKMAYNESDRRRADSAHMQGNDPYGFSLKTERREIILVVNCGSSSLKYSLYDTADEVRNAEGLVENIGRDSLRHVLRTKGEKTESMIGPGGHREAFAVLVREIIARKCIASAGEITAVGHRVVHGGEIFTASVMITDEVLAKIDKLSNLAPLHNPVNVLGISEARRAFPHALHVAVFDTTFHHTLPSFAYLYGLPHEYYEKFGIRRYGFHGTSHRYVALKTAQFLKRPFNELEIITCHLGNGASMCAIDHGRSVDTTMGFTPTAGLIMGTRCGDVDPGVFPFLIHEEGLDAKALDELINRKSGLKGMSGVSHDMRELEQAAAAGDSRALLAIKTFCYQIRKNIGAYVAAMKGLDAVVFTGGIGENSDGVRSLACQGLDCMGISIDENKNKAAKSLREAVDISADASRIRVLAIPTDEQRMIARETLRAIERDKFNRIIVAQPPAPISIEVSAHHVHLSQEHVEALFGKGHALAPESELSQPGQYACKEKVNLVGPKGKVERVRVLGPARKETQVEISMTEQFRLGIHPPIRESGDVANTPGLTLEGEGGRTAIIDKGVICAMRHIHMSPEDALRLGLSDRYVVRVRVEGDRELIFGDVLVRVNPNFKLAMHIDTDEANAANLKTGTAGYIEGIQSKN